MHIHPFSRSQQGVPKSILFDRCQKSIAAGRREDSVSLLLRLSELCQDETERRILMTLKSGHRIRFEKTSGDWIKPMEIVGVTSHIINVSNGTSIQGGRRTHPETADHGCKPKVSIITVNRNCAEGLEKTIKSAIGQKREMAGIEHIVIDGASTDNSIQILRKYEDQIDYFISEPDGGIYSAMNKGLSLAQGDIIAFLNADDTYRRGAVKSSVENIERNRIDISYGAFAYIKSNGYNEMIDGPREWDEALLIRGIPGGHGTFFVTRDAYNKVGGYREDLKIVSDYDWMIRAFLAGCTAIPLVKILHEMTQGGISFNRALEKKENRRLLTEYLGESDQKRLDELYSLKYYLNWNGLAKPQQEQIRLLEMAENLQDFEPIYAQALVRTVNKSAQKFNELNSPPPQKLNENKLRVCVAVTYLNAIAGGAERIAIEAANRLANEGHAVTIICCHGLSGEPFYEIDARIDFLDLANKPLSRYFHTIGSRDWETPWKQALETLDSHEAADIDAWLNDANKWRTLVYKGFFRSNCFDIVLSHMPSTYPYIAMALAGEPSRPQHIAALHNSPSYKFYSPLYSTCPESEKRVWLSTLGMCDRISVLFSEFIDELPEKFRSKAFVLPNFIDSAFRCDPAPSDAMKLNRKIVTIGRLVPQKNHKALIDAFALIQDRIAGWSLEIYGEGPMRQELEEYCSLKGLDAKSILLGRTDSPNDAYNAADIFVFPSHFEGFGLALVEAMACGLPVVGFDDCPGVKFIIENEVNGLLVKRDECSISLAEAILKLAGDKPLRSKLGACAILAAGRYTLDKHITQLEIHFRRSPKAHMPGSERNHVSKVNSNVAIMCTNPSGGAGIAALRLQSGLNKIGFSTCMFSSANGNIEPSFTLKPTIKEPELNSDNWKISNSSNLRYPGGTIFSSELGSLSRSAIKPVIAYDIINLHWVSHFLSPTSIHWLLDSGKPVVWTLHDMLPFTGGCHYTSGCDHFTANCENCPQVFNDYNNHPKNVLKAKSRLWQDRITIISPSVWLANEARKSKIFANSRIETVPNGIDTLQYQPWDKNRARKILGLPQDKKIILFACHSHAERRKGFQEALMMLISLSRRRQDLHLVTIGRSSDETDGMHIPNTVFGFVNSSKELSMIYSACDVTVLPSLEDNLPNTILESFACGTPVAGFRAGGIGDLVKDGVTGHLAPLKDILALRDAVEKCIDSELGESCRSYAVKNLDCTIQAYAYAEIFRSLSEIPRKDATKTWHGKTTINASLLASDGITGPRMTVDAPSRDFQAS